MTPSLRSPTRCSSASRAARPAPMPARSASSTPGCSGGCGSSSRSRPRCSRSWPARPTSRRASPPSWSAGRPCSKGVKDQPRRIVLRRAVNRMPRVLAGPRHVIRRRRVLALCLAVAVLAPLPPAATAFGHAFSPAAGGSPPADKIDTLYWLVMVVAIVVFLGVEGALFYSLFKFRARRGAVAAQIRGNTRLEIGWTIGAAVILVVLAVVTFIQLPGIRTPPNSGPNGLQLADRVLVAAGPTKDLPPNGKSLNICVNGQQYVWRYTYAQSCEAAPLNSVFSYTEMVVPTDTTVTLDITAQDVAHSWWIPKLGGKFDAVPGYFNHTWFKVPGKLAGTTFTGQCAELCGRNHADMVAEVKAVSPSDFEAWLDQQKSDIEAADKAAQEQRKQFESQTSN